MTRTGTVGVGMPCGLLPGEHKGTHGFVSSDWNGEVGVLMTCRLSGKGRRREAAC